MKVSTRLLNPKPNILMALSVWLILSLSCISAAELKLIPEAPLTVVDRQITLSVSGATGKVTWIAQPGRINGTGNQVLYTAPSQSGVDIVTVLDEAGNHTLVKITVLSQEDVAQKYSIENANWAVFNTRRMTDFLYTKDGETLWIATNGGLEEREANTGELRKIFTMLDGFPSNRMISLAHDFKDGLWVGTADKGLVHLDAKHKIVEILDNSNSELPNNAIIEIKNDNLGGLWVGARYSDEYETESMISGFFSLASGGDNLYAYDFGRDEINFLTYFDSEMNSFSIDNESLVEELYTTISTTSISTFHSDERDSIWIVASETFEKETQTTLRHLDLEFYNPINVIQLHNNEVSAILPDSLGGFWVGTTENGLIHLLKNGDLESFNTSNSSIPSNKIVALHFDALNNLKVGYSLDDGWGIATLNIDGYWERLIEYKQKGLFNNEIRSLARDKKGKLWIKTADENHIHYFTKNRLIKTLHLNEPAVRDLLHVDIFDNLWFSSTSGLVRYTPKGEWKTFDLTSFGAANNDIYGITSDAEGTLWISVYTDSYMSYEGAKILRKFVDERWEIINTDVFEQGARALQIDSHGELWLLTQVVDSLDVEIYHRFADGNWETFTEKETGVSHMTITTLHVSANKEVWIGNFEGSIFHRSLDGKWAEILKTPFRINTILSDDMGGLWVGTGLNYDGVGGGLMYRQPDGNWLTFNTSNSGLAGNYITSLVSDGSGGLWVGTLLNGLQHLTFGTASQIIQDSDSYKGLGAAIIIAGGGSHKENQLWNATASISNRIYKMLKKRGFDNSQIYYLSPQSYGDFDGDGFDDCIVDAPATPRCQLSTVEHPIKERPLKIEDIRQALAWAESRGKLDQPLYLFFLDHGVPEKLILSEGEFLKADAFKPMLDQYQQNTSNELILVIDACHSGSFVEHLGAPNRAIISSAKAEEKAAFVEKEGFSRFLAKGLESNRSFFEAFEYATEEQTKMLGKRLRFSDRSGITSQTPQLDDNGDGIFNEKDGQQLGQVRIGGNVTFGDVTLTVETHMASTTLQAGQPMTLKAKATSAVGELKRVWAVLRPPKMNFVLDTQGTPILAFPRLNLSPTAAENIWETTWHDAIYNGDYEISFYAEDKEGDIASSDNPLIISVIGGVAPPEEAQVQIVLDKDSYRLGEHLKAELIEDLGWGYDLYAAVLLPGGNEFIALKTTNLTAQANQPQKWLSARTQNSPLTLLDLTLPTDLSAGQYCLYGILSPEKEAVLETRPLWVMAKKCFEVLP